MVSIRRPLLIGETAALARPSPVSTMAPSLLSVLVFMKVLSSCAGATLIPRQSSCSDPNLRSNYTCPSTDLALFPLSLDFSGPMQDGGITFIRCVYPFLSNCQYNVVCLCYFSCFVAIHPGLRLQEHYS